MMCAEQGTVNMMELDYAAFKFNMSISCESYDEIKKEGRNGDSHGNFTLGFLFCLGF